MHCDSSVSSSRLEKKIEVVCYDAYIDGMERKSSGMEKVVETLPHFIIPSIRRSSPSAANVGEGGIRDVEAVEPPEAEGGRMSGPLLPDASAGGALPPLEDGEGPGTTSASANAE